MLAWANIHVGVLHSEGLWSSWVDGSQSVADLLLARTKDGFCRVSCGIVPRKVELQPVPEDYEGWNMLPPILQVPVADLDSFLLTTKYELKADSTPQSLINVLSDLMNMSLRDYQEAIIHWMEDNMLENPVAEDWW